MADLVYDARRQSLAAGRSLFEQADELAVAVPASCRRTGRCRECVVQVVRGAESLSPRTDAEAFLPAGFRLACQAVVERTDRDVEFAILRRRLRILTSAQDEAGAPADLDPAVSRDGDVVHCDGEPLGRAGGRLLGLAVDVGTTTVVAEVVDLESGRPVAAVAFENPQRFGGSDVMSRIAYEAERPGLLRQSLRRALNRELAAAYRTLGFDRHDVYEAVIVGNPTMRDLFFGVDVAPLGHAPFRSLSEVAAAEGRARGTGLVRRAHELGLLIHPQGRVVGAPLVACHVGADTAADLVATDFAARSGVSLLVDIGTNTELVIGDGRRFLAASSPAGPAFEGGGVSHGMAGADGAVESVWRVDGGFGYRTIGDQPPEGLCGSGLVDLLAESVRAGLLLSNTRLAGSASAIELVPERGIELTRGDVSALAQAKAANACGQQILMRRLGVPPERVDRVFLAGAFANALDVRNAIAIGLLPPVAVERVERVGNAAIRGARALLLSRRRREELERMLARVEHVALEAEPDFFDLFVDGCRFDPVEAGGAPA